MRRLPIYLVIDVSESMAGDNLRHLQQGMERLVKSLRADPYALETAYLSVIAFAGRAKTLTPLVDLLSFYPPRLPLGSGTSIGAALTHLMDEIAKSVKRSTPEVKGDFKPVVYFMSDGKSTDDVGAALARWSKDFASRASLVAIGIGPYADLEALGRLTPNVLRFEGSSDADFRRFVDWISASVSSQSRSIGAGEPAKLSLEKVDPSIMRKIDDIAQATAVDEDFVIINGKCQQTRLPYLIRFDRQRSEVGTRDFAVDTSRYVISGVFPAEADFAELSDPRATSRTVSTAQLVGSPGCPHCGASVAMASCSCGQIFCVSGPGKATCPGCERTLDMVASEGEFDISRARG